MTMNAVRRGKIENVLENMIRIGIVFVLAITVVLMGIAIFDRSYTEQEAYTGSFNRYDFNTGWILNMDGKEEVVTLPVTVDCELGEVVTIVNHLPDDISDGMSLMIRAAMEDIRIDVDGKTREEYSSEKSSQIPYHIPSAYVIADLNKQDSGKDIAIRIRFKAKPVISEVTLSHGNNNWFPVLKNAMPTNLIAMLVLILGLALYIIVLFLDDKYNMSAPRNMGLLMIDVALWVFSESTIRQLIFRRASLAQYFAYFTVELIGILACMFFDAVQHRIYHRFYLFLETVGFSILVLNVILNFLGGVEMYRTIIISHIWTGVCALVSIICIIVDICRKRISEYRITGLGMFAFVAISMCELVGFYINRFHIFGTYLCIALILLMTCTVIQTVQDEVKAFDQREKNQAQLTINTIETIAGAIDARDEYTGGHSERVGLYATRLAREMAADYDLSEEDILRIHYIGLVHDIGKIGVADSVLNKSGKLTDEEFSLMKKHSEIGYEIMGALDKGIPDILDGIRHHHERFDGKGYPDGLSDTDIPLIARILAIADSYDAMTSNRVYRKRLSDEEVRTEFLRCSGTQFDPALTEIFIRLIDREQIKPSTLDGVAVDEEGKAQISSMLESRMQNDMMERQNIVNPSHVRMLCYIIKLMERKGRHCRVFFAGIKDDTQDLKVWNKLRTVLGEYLGPHDINIQYSKIQNVIALYDRTDEETDDFLESIRKNCPLIGISEL